MNDLQFLWLRIPIVPTLGKLVVRSQALPIQSFHYGERLGMGKLFGSRLLRKVADGCLQMHGGMGFMNEMLISRYYRDARIIAIGAGADEVMSDVIAKLEGY